MITHIATTAVYTDDQERAVRFWTTQVGFAVHRKRSMTADASWIEVGPPGAQSCLVIDPKSLMEDWRERKPSIVFECANLRNTCEEMRGRGVAFQQEPKELPWGPFAIFEDPDGNAFGLRQAAADQRQYLDPRSKAVLARDPDFDTLP